MYALNLLQDGSYVTAHNQSSPQFCITGLRENSNYTFEVCASNYEYWMDNNCSAPFVGLTAKRYGKVVTLSSAIRKKRLYWF